MRELALNMIAGISLENPDDLPSSSDLDGIALQERMAQFASNVEEHLSIEYVEAKVQAFKETAQAQGQEIIWRNRNPVVQNEIETQDELEKEREELRTKQGRQGRVVGSEGQTLLGPSILDAKTRGAGRDISTWTQQYL